MPTRDLRRRLVEVPRAGRTISSLGEGPLLQKCPLADVPLLLCIQEVTVGWNSLHAAGGRQCLYDVSYPLGHRNKFATVIMTLAHGLLHFILYFTVYNDKNKGTFFKLPGKRVTNIWIKMLHHCNFIPT